MAAEISRGFKDSGKYIIFLNQTDTSASYELETVFVVRLSIFSNSSNHDRTNRGWNNVPTILHIHLVLE